MGSRSPGFLLREARVVLVMVGQEEGVSEQSMPDLECVGLTCVSRGIRKVSRA